MSRRCPTLKHQDSCNSINASDLQALELLDKITRVMDSQIQAERELNISIVEQMVLMGHSSKKAGKFGSHHSFVSKIGRMRQEREKVSSAIQLLETHAAQLESAICTARRNHAVLEGDWGSTSTIMDDDIDHGSSLPSMGSIFGIDLTPHESFAQEIEDILTCSSSSSLVHV
jgi:hypothetical protein